MNRREALMALAASAATMDMRQAFSQAAGARVPLGIQFFTFIGRNGAAMGWDKYSAYLQQVREIGYDGVELAGFSGYRPDQIARRAQELGLDIPSVHIGFDEVFVFLPPQPWGPDTFSQAQDVVYSPVGVVQLARLLAGPSRDVGARFATIAGGGKANFSSVDNVMRFADGLNKANVIAQSKGIALSFHPHAPEFTPLDGGRSPMDIIIANTDASIRYELDIYWSALGSGEAPQDTTRRLASRLALFHLKDKGKDGKIATPGEGTFDFAAIKMAAQKVRDPYFFVERDGATDPQATASSSYSYLRPLGFGLRA
jgi:sugar phosphate isomerase/epimerase